MLLMTWDLVVLPPRRPPNNPKKRESTFPLGGEPAASITTLSSNPALRVPTLLLSPFGLVAESSKTTSAAVKTAQRAITNTLEENILLVESTLNWLVSPERSTALYPGSRQVNENNLWKTERFWRSGNPASSTLYADWLASLARGLLYGYKSRRKRCLPVSKGSLDSRLSLILKNLFWNQVPWKKVKVLGFPFLYLKRSRLMTRSC